MTEDNGAEMRASAFLIEDPTEAFEIVRNAGLLGIFCQIGRGNIMAAAFIGDQNFGLAFAARPDAGDVGETQYYVVGVPKRFGVDGKAFLETFLKEIVAATTRGPAVIRSRPSDALN